MLQLAIAVRAREAFGVELLAALALEVRALDAAVAGLAHAAVELVVVSLAVGRVVDHVERRRLEGLRARAAHEALLVVAARQTAVGRGDGFALDGEAATFAVTFGGGCAVVGW